MANLEHLEILEQGVAVWNQWRKEISDSGQLIRPNLSHAALRSASLSNANLSNVDLNDADLSGAILTGANLFGADLNRACLSKAHLRFARLFSANLNGANLSHTNLVGTYLMKADLSRADLRHADLRSAKLNGANLSCADFSDADLRNTDMRGANLTGATLIAANLICADISFANCRGTDFSTAILQHADLVQTNFSDAILTDCSIFGVSVWGAELRDAKQKNLIITPEGEPIITVDDVEVAQFIYLLINNKRIRHIIDTITTKVVLILGRFTPERKVVLDAIRNSLRQSDYIPVLFDFDKPYSRDFIETIATLAHLARFVIADFTDARIVIEEVTHIVHILAVPVAPLLLSGSGYEPVTLFNLRVNHLSVLDTCFYNGCDDLIASIEEKVIAPAEQKLKELNERKIWPV